MSRAARGSQRGAKVTARAGKAKATKTTAAKAGVGNAKAAKVAKPKVAKAATVKAKAKAATVTKAKATAKATATKATGAKATKATEATGAKATGAKATGATGATATKATVGQGAGVMADKGTGLPEVVVRSGRLAVADPVAAAGVILERPIADGEYPVELTLAEGRPVALVARLGAGAVARWDVAARVDLEAGVVALADRDAFAAIAAEAGGFPTPSFRAIERQLLEEHYAGGWGWASYQPERLGSCVAIVLDAAAAEVAWGLDEAGRPVALRVTPAP